MKRSMEESNNPSILLQCMGITGDNQDPSTALADWVQVAKRLETHPKEAKKMYYISFPLNLALCNRVTPAPAQIIRDLIRIHPEAASEEDFGNACRYAHTKGAVLEVLLGVGGDRGLFPSRNSKDFVKRWDLDWIACNNNISAANALIENCEAANPSCIKEWKEMRPSSHTFWFSLLMQRRARVVSEDNIKRKRLLQFFILQGNYENVELILNTYPDLLSSTSFRGNKKEQLPLHTALSTNNSTEYRPWHNRSPIVRMLLQRGFDARIGGDNGCGGLYVKDSYCDALTYALDAALNCQWEDPERRKCLEICLQFAHAHMFGRTSKEVDLDKPMLHASIGVVQIGTFMNILKNYGITTLDQDKDGRTALFDLITLVTNRPPNGCTATKNIMANKKRERERDMTDRNFVFARVARFEGDARDRDPFDQLAQHQGRQGLEVMAQRLWEREQELLGDEDLNRLNLHRQMAENSRLPDALQRLVNALGERGGDRGDWHDGGGWPDLDLNQHHQQMLENPRRARRVLGARRRLLQVMGNLGDGAAAQRQNHPDQEDMGENGDRMELEQIFQMPPPQEGIQNQGAQPPGDQDQAANALPRRIPFIFQPIRHILNARGNNRDIRNNEEAVIPGENNHQIAGEGNNNNGEVEEVENNERGLRLNPGPFRRVRPERRVPHQRRFANNPLRNGDNGDDENNMDITLHQIAELRNMAEARERELDEIQERMIEKQYFASIREILLKQVFCPLGNACNAERATTNCARIHDKYGRLPIHFAAESGLPANQGFRDILAANPEAVCEPDGCSGLYPFSLVASNPNSALDVGFELLLQNPSVMDYVLGRETN